MYKLPNPRDLFLDNGGTERALAMTKMAYPDWIIEE